MSKSENKRRKNSILIIDDEYLNLKSLSNILESEGYDVRGAADAKNGFMIIENKPPDLILLDVKLPGMDGHEICQKLKESKETAALPVIFLSVMDSKEDIIAGFEAGAVDYITKPFIAAEVLARVKTHLNLRFAMNHLEQEVVRRTEDLTETNKNLSLMKHAVDKSGDRIALIAPDGRFVYVNQAGYQEMGFSLKELLTKRVSDIDLNFSQKQWLKHFDEIKRKGSIQLRTEQTDGNGQIHIIDVRSNYISFEGEEYICGFGRDITDEIDLISKLKAYENMIKSNANPIALVNTEFMYEAVNPSYCELFNKSVDEVVGTYLPDLIGRNIFAGNIKKHYEDCFAGNTVRYQMWYELPTNGKRYFDIGYAPHFGETGEIIAAVTNIVDITKIIEAEAALAESEIKFKSFMDKFPANIYLKDENDIHLYVNKMAANTIGKSVDEIVGSTTYDFFDMDHDRAAILVEKDRKVLEGAAPSVSEEWLLDSDDRRHFFRDIKFPIELDSGKKLLGGIALDITELKEKERHLQEAFNEISNLKNLLEKENITLREQLQTYLTRNEIIGSSELLLNCLHEAEHVAAETSTVMILGETGTGKELLAQAIHDMSPRKNRLMVKVNCAAIPANLIESELFGREKGAYTGALTSQKGRFELATKSTIFLDEIGDLPLELQSKLLRVLQEGTFEMLGSNKTVNVDVRVITATNQNLEQLVESGKFRKDLYYRINVFPITIPPLRERKEDIPLLTWFFVNEFNRSMGKSVSQISDHDLDLLTKSDWPGNVRELKNIIERSMIMTKGPELNLKLPLTSNIEKESEENLAGQKIADVEKKLILQTLEATGWRVSGKKGAAEKLGLKRTTLEARMKKLGITRPT